MKRVTPKAYNIWYVYIHHPGIWIPYANVPVASVAQTVRDLIACQLVGGQQSEGQIIVRPVVDL